MRNLAHSRGFWLTLGCAAAASLLLSADQSRRAGAALKHDVAIADSIRGARMMADRETLLVVYQVNDTMSAREIRRLWAAVRHLGIQNARVDSQFTRGFEVQASLLKQLRGKRGK